MIATPMKTDTDALPVIAPLHLSEYESLPDLVVSAPGVVKLLGEHTVSHHGALMAFSFNRRLSIAISQRRDSSLRLYAADLNERKRTNVSNLKYRREDRWANTSKAAPAHYFDHDGPPRGYNVTISGDIPQGLGLGSMAALSCVCVRAAATLAAADTSDDAIAKAVAAINREYYEQPVNDRAYLATIRAREGSILFIDAAKRSYENLPSPFGDYALVLTDSRVPRLPVSQELLDREADCQHGLSILGGKSPPGLRAYGVSDLDEMMGQMPEHVRRHCTFYIEEVQRVKEARTAVKEADIAVLGKIVNKSQAGLRNHYEVSCPEIDWLVKRAQELSGAVFSRMASPGFGGCTITLMESRAMEEYVKRLEEYERIFGFKPVVWTIGRGTGMSAS